MCVFGPMRLLESNQAGEVVDSKVKRRASQLPLSGLHCMSSHDTRFVLLGLTHTGALC